MITCGCGSQEVFQCLNDFPWCHHEFPHSEKLSMLKIENLLQCEYGRELEIIVYFKCDYFDVFVTKAQQNSRVLLFETVCETMSWANQHSFICFHHSHFMSKNAAFSCESDGLAWCHSVVILFLFILLLLLKCQ